MATQKKMWQSTLTTTQTRTNRTMLHSCKQRVVSVNVQRKTFHHTVCGPDHVCNSPPPSLRRIDSHAAFQRALKRRLLALLLTLKGQFNLEKYIT